MDRRHFFKTTALGAGILALDPFTSCRSKTNSVPGTNIQNGMPGLDEMTVDQLQLKMKSKEITAEDITGIYLRRIEEIDTKGLSLKSVLEINPDAMEIARQLDLERQNGKIRGPLHGIPVMIKDNIDTHDKMQTTAGSLALEGFHAPEDAFIVKKLRESGAVLLGKTNLSEWANFRSTRSSSGWSARGGQVKNPYDISRSPCGSSSGSAVAVSANLCVLSIGTETNGSIVCPSGINGIVGIKPTLGLWSRTGIIPIAQSQDTAGPMARTVRDAAYLLKFISGRDEKDRETLNIPAGIHLNEEELFNKNALKGKRIGIIRDYMGFHSEVDKLTEMALDDMKSSGTEIIDVACGEKKNEWGSASYKVLLYEFKAGLNRYLSERTSAPVRSLEDIITFNKNHADKEMPWFGQEIFLKSVALGDLDTKEYIDARTLSRQLSRKAIDDPVEEYNLDALIAPTNGPAWKIDLINGDHFGGGSSGLAAVSGYPGITVPAGSVHGLPVGISFIGKAWEEEKLISIAYAYEQATLHRKKPILKSG